MKTGIKTLVSVVFLLEKEFKQFFRDPGLPKMVIMFPVLMMLVFPYAVSMDIKNINLAVVDNCRSTESDELVKNCTSSGYFNLVTICDDPSKAMIMMEKNDVDAILTINPDFSRNLVKEGTMSLGIKINTVNGTKGNIGAGYLNSCMMKFASSSDSASGEPVSGSIVTSTKYYYNPYMDYKVFMVPALIVIAITMITGFFPALNIVSEKERGTIEQINVTPVKKSAFIICKLIPYWLVAFFILTACLLIAKVVFGYRCAGDLSALYLFTTLHIIVTAGLGLLISNYSENAQQSMFITWFFMMIFMLVSGIFTPISSMPAWARAITYFNPMRYYADAMRSVFLKGSTVIDVWYDAAGLAVIGASMLIAAIRGYRKTT